LTAGNSRATYAAAWFDGLGRTVKTANYGTNGGGAQSVLDDPNDDFNPGVSGTQSYAACAAGMDPNPAASDYCIIATTAYDGFRRAWKTTDNAGRSTAVGFDSAGRRAYLAENYVDFSLSASETGIGGGAGDEDRVTKFTYNELGLLKEQIALDANTALNQTTHYVYAFELGDKGCPIHRPELLRGIIFPDSGDTVSTPIGSGSIAGTDHVTYTYYCNGARATATDQRGIVRTYTYDGLGRLTADAVTTVPESPPYSIDTAVLRIGRTYDPNGAVASVTSYDNVDGGAGHEVNQIKYARLENITLPGGRQVYCNHEMGGAIRVVAWPSWP
jgi:YD repeat-containing protein